MNTFTAIPARGLGASHQTGWTGLVAKLMQQQGSKHQHRETQQPVASGDAAQ